MTYITRATVAAAIREARKFETWQEAQNRYYFRQFSIPSENYVPDCYAPRTIAQRNAAAREKAYNEAIPAYGWPGGYDLAYYPTDEYGSLDGSVLCRGCARKELQDNKDARLHVESTDGYEGDDSHDHLYCDDCHGVICEAWQRDEDEDADTAEYDTPIAAYGGN
jgi:hypothetical protein